MVRSETGAETCVIDCELSGRGFYFHTGEGEYSVVDGFTIRNGSAYSGGGVHCFKDSSPTIINCAIIGNSAEAHGGGAYCSLGSNPTITNCTITANSTTRGAAEVYGCLSTARGGLNLVGHDIRVLA